MTAERVLVDLRPSLRHGGPCGRRVDCWRLACRDLFHPYRTVEVLGRQVVAYCHGERYDRDDLIARNIVAA